MSSSNAPKKMLEASKEAADLVSELPDERPLEKQSKIRVKADDEQKRTTESKSKDTKERMKLLEAREEAKSGIQAKPLPLELISASDFCLVIGDDLSD